VGLGIVYIIGADIPVIAFLDACAAVTVFISIAACVAAPTILRVVERIHAFAVTIR
jgi:hypothetical protein